MSVDDLKTHIDDVLNILSENSEKGNVSKEEVEKELKRFIEYGVPIEQAKQTLIQKYGGSVKFNTASSSSSSERILISDIEPNQYNVNMLCHVIAINPKEITVKGENKQIFYGILGDESGTIPFTAWNDIEVEKGDVIEVTNAYTREWQGAAQLNFGDKVSIKKTDKDKLPKAAFEPHKHKVCDLKSGLGSVEVTGRIIEVKARDVTVKGEVKKVFSGIIGDETGKAQFTSWHDFKLKDDDVINISGGYVKSWKGIPQLTFDDKSIVEKLDKNKIPKDKLSKATKMSLHELVDKQGMLDVEVEGTIIEIRSGSGIIMRCPECNRALRGDECAIHGPVKGTADLRLKLIIDDGAGVVSSSINRDLSEKLLGKTFDEIKKIDEDSLNAEMNKLLFTRKIRLTGNALSDEFGTTFISKNVELFEVDVKEETAKITKDLEGLL